jgi:hypothetical protein
MRVGKGALAPCPLSIDTLILNGGHGAKRASAHPTHYEPIFFTRMMISIARKCRVHRGE